MKFQIGPLVFHTTDPYAEGHVLSANEARALNMYRADRLRRATTRRLDGLKKEKEENNEADFAIAQDFLKELDSSYSFEEARRFEPRTKGDTIETELEALRQERGLEAEAFSEDLLEQAKQRLEKKRLTAKKALEELLSI